MRVIVHLVCVCFTYNCMQYTREVHTLGPTHGASCQHKGMCEAVHLYHPAVHMED